MLPVIIGISSALCVILFIAILKQFDKKLLYALILAGIGFLYVGFVWTDVKALIINSAQAILFVFLAYYGFKKSISVLVAGYFLHGCWDLIYNFIATPGLVPPHYDLFCSFLDFVIGIYIIIFMKDTHVKKIIS